MANKLNIDGQEFDPENYRNYVYKNYHENPILHQAFELVRLGHLTFDQALALAAIELVKDNEKLEAVLREWVTKAIMVPTVRTGDAIALYEKTRAIVPDLTEDL